MVRKHIAELTQRKDRGKRPQVDDSSNPSQGTIPYKRTSHRRNNITAQDILYGKQTVREFVTLLN